MAQYITESQADTRYQSKMPIEITQWDENNNTYSTVDVWEDANTTIKGRALKNATAFINSLDFDGEKAQESQDNAFPRNDQQTTPEEVKQACFELALFFVHQHKLNEYSDPTIRVAMERNVERYSVEVMNASESYTLGEQPSPMSVVKPYLKKWMKAGYKTTRWSV